MPGKHIDQPIDQPCRRCKENSAVLVVRSQPLCRECFFKYVQTKTIKRLESFRVRNASPDHQRTLLLPLSFGVSSVSLLHILDCQLKTQMRKTGRTGFALHVVYVEIPGNESFISSDNLTEVKKAYPDFQYSSLPLHDVFRLSSDTALTRLCPQLNQNEDASPHEKLTGLMNSLTSATARADVLSTLTTRLIVEHAKASGCESILWGDTTTKLAEKTLSETAKGRGFSLPWQVSDGESPYGIAFHYPLRDVLKKELVSYVDLVNDPISALVCEPSTIRQASMSSKNTTIDDLMSKYFEEVEMNFPSIVSNVVRTTGKLEAVSAPASAPRCDLCSMPVPDGRFGIHGWGGDQQDGVKTIAKEGSSQLCYGCTRSIPQPSV
ncbi:cytoplasmic tRNA 2-thiolation protein-like protein 2 [Periconia macrospinosa]|uniref:Cytoplasmic tRNA 2-thiolation protein 2 n=1 Tax=Periconia macrospinosa TaxID=97972 RepID=A0A2V1D7S5_9PLEO|nr:cytoplasmic tRNA 2-thiolation protein-like protein 2 [Periconia macrospinosa]